MLKKYQRDTHVIINFKLICGVCAALLHKIDSSLIWITDAWFIGLILSFVLVIKHKDGVTDLFFKHDYWSN
jgi:hypothetical protein